MPDVTCRGAPRVIAAATSLRCTAFASLVRRAPSTVTKTSRCSRARYPPKPRASSSWWPSARRRLLALSSFLPAWDERAHVRDVD